jgi:hypothetical protein
VIKPNAGVCLLLSKWVLSHLTYLPISISCKNHFPRQFAAFFGLETTPLFISVYFEGSPPAGEP